MKVTLHPEAEQDIAQALDFYREVAGVVVAARFLAEFERVVRFLVRHPALGTPQAGGRRSFPMRVFPYALVYRELEGGLRILVVRHQRRRPSFGNRRTG